jgi:tetratricopeptide (TPR) repeat protein
MNPRVRVLFASGAACVALWSTACSRSPQYYVEKGNQLYASGKYDDAVLNYRKAIQKKTSFGEAYYGLGLTAIKQNHAEDAAGALSRAVELLPENRDAREKLADIYLNSYLIDSSRPKFYYDRLKALSADLLAKDPKSFAGLRLKGYLALTDRKPKEAAEDFQKAYEVQSTDAGVAVSWVQALFLDERFDEGETLARNLIQKHPNFGRLYDLLYERYVTSKRQPEGEAILKLKVANNPKSAPYTLQLARYYLAAQKPADAAAVLKRMVDDKADFPQARLQIGDFYYLMGNWPEAIRYYEEGSRADPKQALVYQEKVTNALLAQGKRDEAAKMVDSIMKDHPGNEEARKVSATLSAETGKPEAIAAATAEFKLLSKTRSKDADLYYKLGRVYQLSGKTDEAKDAFHEALNIQKDFLLPRYELAEISLAEARPQAAMQYSSEILSARPTDTRARFLHASALMGKGDYPLAREEFTQLVKQDPQNADAQLQLGFLNLREQKFNDAAAVFHALAGKGDARAIAGLAEVYVAQNRLDEAMQLLSTSMQSSNAPLLRLELARVAVRAGKYAVAETQYRELLTRAPNSVELQLGLGDAYQLKGDFPRAIAVFQDAVKSAPKDPVPLMYLGAAFDKAGRASEATASYRRALALQPDNTSAMNNLAYILAETGGSLDEALRLAQRAVAKAPQDPNLKDTLGWIYVKQNMTDSGLQIFQNLVRQYPKVAMYRYHLGVALFAKGDKAKARSELTLALANRPLPDDEQKIKDFMKRLN